MYCVFMYGSGFAHTHARSTNTKTNPQNHQVLDGFVAIADEANAGCTQLVLRDLREAFTEELVRAHLLV